MSILHRTAYLSLSALLAIVPAACGGDDDDDGDGGGTPDSGGGGQADAGGGTPDSGGGEADSGGGEADAAPVEGDFFLLGLDLEATALGMTFTAGVRLIAAIDVADDGASADITLQPVLAPQCVADMPEMSGLPVGDPRTETAVAIGKDGSIELTLADAVLPMGSVGSDDTDLPCGVEIVGELTVSGTVQKTGPCGDVDGTIAMPVAGTVTGTFGSVAIEEGQEGPDLPKAVTACP